MRLFAPIRFHFGVAAITDKIRLAHQLSESRMQPNYEFSAKTDCRLRDYLCKTYIKDKKKRVYRYSPLAIMVHNKWLFRFILICRHRKVIWIRTTLELSQTLKGKSLKITQITYSIYLLIEFPPSVLCVQLKKQTQLCTREHLPLLWLTLTTERSF